MPKRVMGKFSSKNSAKVAEGLLSDIGLKMTAKSDTAANGFVE
jgi:hypothetical protein